MFWGVTAGPLHTNDKDWGIQTIVALDRLGAEETRVTRDLPLLVCSNQVWSLAKLVS